MREFKSMPSEESGEMDNDRFFDPHAEVQDLAECLGLAKLEPDGDSSRGNGERELKLLA